MENPFRSDPHWGLLTIMKIKGGKSATPIVRTAIAATTNNPDALARTANLKFESTRLARLITAIQLMEQQKKGTSVRGMVLCFITTYDSKDNEQISRMSVLSSKNSRLSTEEAASSPTARKTMFKPTITQGWAKPTFNRTASNAG